MNSSARYIGLSLLISITTFVAHAKNIEISNRTDIRCAAGDCRTLCRDTANQFPLYLSLKCDGRQDFAINPGETKVVALPDGDYTSFCLEDGAHQFVRSASVDRMVYIGWQGFRQKKAVCLLPRNVQAKAVFNNQVTLPCSSGLATAKK